MGIKWSNIAKLNLKDISKYYKKEYAKSLAQSISLLSDNNYLGKKIRMYDSLEIRQLVHCKHRILYCIFNNSIYILIILNSAQDISLSLKLIHRIMQNTDLLN